MSELYLGIKFGVVGAALAQTAMGNLKGALDGLGRSAEMLSGRQARIGQALAQAMAHPNRNLADLRRRYDEIGRAIEDVRRRHEALSRAMARRETLAAERQRMGGEAMGTYATAAAVGAPVVGSIKAAAGFGDAVKDIAIVGDLTREEEKKLGTSLRAIAIQVNQTAEDMAKGVSLLIANGMEANKAAQQAALLGKFTTATRATFDDAARMMVSFDALGVSAQNMDLAFSQAAKAGKLGSFEVKDMAKWFPQLGGYFKALGVTGNEAVVNMASRLQIAMKTAGSTDEAANNFRNFLSKLTSPDTAKDFEKLGIDLQGSMLRLARQGLDPIEGAVGIVMTKLGEQSPQVAAELKALATDIAAIEDPAKRAQELERRRAMVEALGQRAGLGQMFQDMQAVGYLLAEIQNRGELKRVRTETQSGRNADGQMSLDADFAKRMESPLEQFKALKIQVLEMAISVGEALLPAALDLARAVGPIVKGFADWAKANPGVLTAVVGLAVGVTAFKVAALGLGWALNFLVKSPIAAVMAAWQGLAARVLIGRAALLAGAGPLRAIASAAGLSQGVLMRFGAAFAWLRGAAAMAWRFLLPFGQGLLMALWMPLKLAGMGVMALGRVLTGGLATGLRVAGQALLWLGRAAMMNPIGLTLTAIAGAAYLIWQNWGTIGPKLAAVWDMVKSGFDSVWTWLQGVPQRMMEIGGNIIDGLSAGIRSKLESVKAAAIEAAQGAVATVKGALGIQSPSRVFMGLGSDTAAGLALGLTEGQGAVGKAAGALALAATLAGTPHMSMAGPALEAMAFPASDAFRTIHETIDPITLPGVPDAFRTIHEKLDPAQLPGDTRALRTVTLADTLPPMPAGSGAQPAAQGGGAVSPAVNVTINLNGPATPEAAQGISEAVRREIERVLADQNRRTEQARRARLFDGA